MAGIGCGGLLLVAFIGAGLLLMKGCQKAKEIAGDFQKNPAKAAAMLVLKANPDVEVVSTDDNKGEITIKDKKSGETTTTSFDDLSQGKLTVKNSKGETMTVDASDAKNGKITMNGPDGKVTIGDAANTALPAWVPAYPGAASQPGGMKTEKSDKIVGMTVLQTPDPVAKVKEFFESKLKADGYTTEVNTMNFNGNDSATVSGKKNDGKQTVNVVIATESGKTSVMVNYEGPKS